MDTRIYVDDMENEYTYDELKENFEANCPDKEEYESFDDFVWLNMWCNGGNLHYKED